ncbi:MAG: hypothetical protein PHT02_07105 [Tissierellia bacterium]|nr:hypothetical protein [Tissierellia bacterium]
MQYIVIKSFNDMGTYKQIGDYVVADDGRAAKLRRMGLIGGQFKDIKSFEEVKDIKPFEEVKKQKTKEKTIEKTKNIKSKK